jgi:hypothetical protein
MRQRSPDFKFVEIIKVTFQGGRRSRAMPIARV